MRWPNKNAMVPRTTQRQDDKVAAAVKEIGVARDLLDEMIGSRPTSRPQSVVEILLQASGMDADKEDACALWRMLSDIGDEIHRVAPVETPIWRTAKRLLELLADQEAGQDAGITSATFDAILKEATQ